MKIMYFLTIFLLVYNGFKNSLYAQRQPNILLILSDKTGYRDFGFQGRTIIKTPELVKLVSKRMIIKQAYVTASVCGSSRASKLTGKYQQRFGYKENNVPRYGTNSTLIDDDMGLSTNHTTRANYLKDIGYKTALVGKRHQGNTDKYHSTKRGYDDFYDFKGGSRKDIHKKQ